MLDGEKSPNIATCGMMNGSPVAKIEPGVRSIDVEHGAVAPKPWTAQPPTELAAFPEASVRKERSKKRSRSKADTLPTPVDSTVDVKKQRRLIRNRMSAQLHRERKRIYVESLEGKIKELESSNSELRVEVGRLTEENASLRGKFYGSQRSTYCSSCGSCSDATSSSAMTSPMSTPSPDDHDFEDDRLLMFGDKCELNECDNFENIRSSVEGANQLPKLGFDGILDDVPLASRLPTIQEEAIDFPPHDITVSLGDGLLNSDLDFLTVMPSSEIQNDLSVSSAEQLTSGGAPTRSVLLFAVVFSIFVFFSPLSQRVAVGDGKSAMAGSLISPPTQRGLSASPFSVPLKPAFASTTPGNPIFLKRSGGRSLLSVDGDSTAVNPQIVTSALPSANSQNVSSDDSSVEASSSTGVDQEVLLRQVWALLRKEAGGVRTDNRASVESYQDTPSEGSERGVVPYGGTLDGSVGRAEDVGSYTDFDAAFSALLSGSDHQLSENAVALRRFMLQALQAYANTNRRSLPQPQRKSTANSSFLVAPHAFGSLAEMPLSSEGKQREGIFKSRHQNHSTAVRAKLRARHARASSSESASNRSDHTSYRWNWDTTFVDKEATDPYLLMIVPKTGLQLPFGATFEPRDSSTSWIEIGCRIQNIRQLQLPVD